MLPPGLLTKEGLETPPFPYSIPLDDSLLHYMAGNMSIDFFFFPMILGSRSLLLLSGFGSLKILDTDSM